MAQTVSHKMPTLTAEAVALEELKKVASSRTLLIHLRCHLKRRRVSTYFNTAPPSQLPSFFRAHRGRYEAIQPRYAIGSMEFPSPHKVAE